MLDSGEETGEGQDVTKSWSSTLSEQEGAIEVGEGSDVGNSSSSMSFECEVQNDVDTEKETDVGELLLEEDKHWEETSGLHTTEVQDDDTRETDKMGGENEGVSDEKNRGLHVDA